MVATIDGLQKLVNIPFVLPILGAVVQSCIFKLLSVCGACAKNGRRQRVDKNRPTWQKPVDTNKGSIQHLFCG